ncbi:MAG: hypothetical protein K6T99_06615 [Armatimonadetes bacterium]|nr:hypothetical protein [Armatimonadota bacterium]
MISCTEFVMAYSELFAFIEDRHGKETLLRFWEQLSDKFLYNLRQLVSEKGLAGMYEYWTHTLTEEGGKHSLILTNDEFRIEMECCPSISILRNNQHLKPYYDYCEHCKVLYKRVIEPFGYHCELLIHDSTTGKCTLRVRRKT